ncbi:MAG TPA: type VI secretion system tip protein TssI/VgrG, partial [Myxococcaceae bacterium]
MAENQLTADLLLGDHEGELTVHAVRGREEVSRPSRFEVDFSGKDVDVDGVVGAPVTLRLESGIGGERHLCGVVEALSVVAADPGGEGKDLRYRATVVPQPYLVLSQRRGFRIFQEKSVPEIVRAVCKDVGLEVERFDWGNVGGTYLSREYCVQYGESEWDFICRLLEDEGVFFAFHHTADGERMCFADASSGVELQSPESLDFSFLPQVDASSARAWDVRHQTRLRPSKATVNDSDMLRPGNPLLASARAEEAVSREWYEYPGGYRAPAEGKRRAQARLDELRTPRVTVRGRTDALVVEAGRRFKLEGHPTLDGEYFLTAVDFHLRLQQAVANGRPLVDEGDCRCEVGFEAIPVAQTFRPARLTARPRAVGLQSARVTGPAGQEIHCDEHGRVKLQFPWDREGQLD